MLNMNASITRDWTVREVLKACPETEQVFFHYETNCVGCWLQRFCTINDVCGAYKLDMNDVINKIQESSTHQSQRRML
jgi:hybrid cluster-associated redox disulfide protein